VWQIPDAVDTVVCAPDDGCKYDPKHVEQFPDINKLCNVASFLDIHVYWNILKMHGPIKVKSPNNTSKWQMEFNSAFKGLTAFLTVKSLAGFHWNLLLGRSVVSSLPALSPRKSNFLTFLKNGSPLRELYTIMQYEKNLSRTGYMWWNYFVKKYVEYVT
jgi:hypothetical protein